MSKTDVLSIFLVFSFIAMWKVLSMSNLPWWVCGAGAGAYALLLLGERRKKTPD